MAARFSGFASTPGRSTAVTAGRTDTTRASRITTRSFGTPRPSCPGSRCRSRSARSRAPRPRRARAPWPGAVLDTARQGAQASCGRHPARGRQRAARATMMHAEQQRVTQHRQVLGRLAAQHERGARRSRCPPSRRTCPRGCAGRTGAGGRRSPTTRPAATSTPDEHPHRAPPQRVARAAATPAARSRARPRSRHRSRSPRTATPITTTVTASSATRDAHAAPRRHLPHEQPGEQHRGRGELGERHVALAHEADADGRRVAEHGVPLEVRAGDEVDDVQHDHGPEPDEHARAPGRRRVAEHAHAPRCTAPTPTMNAQYAAAPPWRPKCNGPAR